MAKFKLKVKQIVYATRYVEADSAEQAKAIYLGEVDDKTLVDIEYDYEEDSNDDEDLLKVIAVD